MSASQVFPVPVEHWRNFQRPEEPTLEDLAAWGVDYNETFHVFYYSGKIYRPQKTVRDMLLSGKLRRRHSH